MFLIARHKSQYWKLLVTVKQKVFMYLDVAQIANKNTTSAEISNISKSNKSSNTDKSVSFLF